MTTQIKIRELEKEIAALWRVVEDERLWHPSVIREIKRRSRMSRRLHLRSGLKKAEEVFTSSFRRP